MQKELNSIELMRLIFEEVKRNGENLNRINEEFKKVDNNFNYLENKIDNEINDRKNDISKVKDFNKIILNDFGSRISILEEESDKYNLN